MKIPEESIPEITELLNDRKIVVIGDIHGRTMWKDIVEKEAPWDRVVFIGDYFDTHENISPTEQQENFRNIARLKEENKTKVVLLIGNHDEHYFPFMGNSGTSGYNSGAAPNNGHLLMTYRDLMQMAHSEGNILFSHAGVGEIWLRDHPDIGYKGEYKFTSAQDISEKVNEMWENRPLSFKFNGYDSTGDDEGQTPVWIRPRSLLRASKNIKEAGIIQIVGHTQMRKIDIEGNATGGKYFFIDTLGTSGEYLIFEKGQFLAKTINTQS